MIAERFPDKFARGRRTRSIETASNEKIEQALIAGLRIGRLSLHTACREVETGQLTTFSGHGLPIMRHWYLVTPGGRDTAATAATLTDRIVRLNRYTCQKSELGPPNADDVRIRQGSARTKTCARPASTIRSARATFACVLSRKAKGHAPHGTRPNGLLLFRPDGRFTASVDGDASDAMVPRLENPGSVCVPDTCRIMRVWAGPGSLPWARPGSGQADQPPAVFRASR